MAWLPYSETGNPPLLKDINCSGFSITKLPDEIISLMSVPSHTSSTSVHESNHTFTYAMPAFTAFAAIVVLAVVHARKRW